METGRGIPPVQRLHEGGGVRFRSRTDAGSSVHPFAGKNEDPRTQDRAPTAFSSRGVV